MAYGTSTTKAALNVRQAANTSSGVLSVIPKGATVTITGPAVNGWYPVSYGGQTGYSSAQYINSFTPQDAGSGGGQTSPAPPQNIPHQQAGGNPFYNPESTYGSHQNWYDTPLVGENTNNFDAEYERWVTQQGFGGFTQKGNLARDMIDRAKSGFTAASMNNPSLTNRNYLNEILGPNFLRNEMAKLTPSQKGESRAIYAPTARWITRD